MPPNDANVVCVVARHGRTVLNATNSFRGKANPPLDSVGLKQAADLAKLMKDFDICCIFSSDKIRATKTAEIISRENGTPVHTTESLRALNVGDFSGKERTPENEASLERYLSNPETTIPGGESLNQFKARVRPCLLEAIKIFETCGKPPLLVAHSSVVRECGSFVYNDHKKVLVQPGGAIAIYVQPNGKLGTEAIFRPMKATGPHAATIT